MAALLFLLCFAEPRQPAPQYLLVLQRGASECQGPAIVSFHPGPLASAAAFPRRWVLREPGGEAAAFQYDPPQAAGAPALITLAKVPAGSPLLFSRGTPPPAGAQPPAVTVKEQKHGVWVKAAQTAFFYDRTQGGLPSAVRLPSGRVLRWRPHDRLYARKGGGFLLREDRQARLSVPVRGPVRVVVEVVARYGGRRAVPGTPTAQYLFEHVAGSDRVQVSCRVQQEEPVHWDELHVLELNFQDAFSGSWSTGEPRAEGVLQDTKQSHRGSQWAALCSRGETIALCDCAAIIYDGKSSYGTYLHGPWVGFSGLRAEFRFGLYAGKRRPAFPSPPLRIRGYVSEVELQQAVERLRHSSPLAGAVLSEIAFRRPFSEYARAVRLFQRHGTAAVPEGIGFLGRCAGDTCVVVNSRTGTLAGLWEGDRRLARAEEGLWELVLRQGTSERSVAPGRSSLRVKAEATKRGWRLTWRGSEGLLVVQDLSLRPRDVAIALAVEALPKGTSLLRVSFPRLTVGSLWGGGEDTLLYPQCSGRLSQKPYCRQFRLRGTYPSGMWPVQCAALYDSHGGLYMACEDETASTKDFIFEGEEAGLRFEARYPAPDMGKAGNTFKVPGCVRLRPFTGDWFTAACMYRSWTRGHVPWLEKRNRPSPSWIEDGAVWALASGAPEKVVPQVTAFCEFFDVPVAFHWYNWHRIPFDTYYPHYFPAKEGFRKAVASLQARGVKVMPYINGRLWDTGLPDFAGPVRAAATKNEKGQVYIEQYGSGRKLAPMCPTVPLWQEKVAEIVRRLVEGEGGVDAVYIDQVAAAKPRLCCDASHGHPLGGGHWWVSRAWRPFLRALRPSLPSSVALTTECTAEPYLDLFDAYLTWHFQYQDQVPLFAAIYGGRIQLFGRAYRGGPTSDLAMRMKTAQAFVFGEQLGWIDPGVVTHAVNGPFLRRLARLRWRLRRFFSEMARPPRFVSAVPEVEADWRWHGRWPVRTKAIQTGAWRSAEGSVVLLFVNVTGERFSGSIAYTPELWGLPAAATAVQKITESSKEPYTESRGPSLTVTLKPYGAWALLLQSRETGRP